MKTCSWKEYGERSWKKQRSPKQWDQDPQPAHRVRPPCSLNSLPSPRLLPLRLEPGNAFKTDVLLCLEIWALILSCCFLGDDHSAGSQGISQLQSTQNDQCTNWSKAPWQPCLSLVSVRRRPGQGTSWHNQALTSHRVSRCLFIKRSSLFASIVAIGTMPILCIWEST